MADAAQHQRSGSGMGAGAGGESWMTSVYNSLVSTVNR